MGPRFQNAHTCIRKRLPELTTCENFDDEALDDARDIYIGKLRLWPTFVHDAALSATLRDYKRHSLAVMMWPWITISTT